MSKGGPPKSYKCTGTCGECGVVRYLQAKGLCRVCYKNSLRNSYLLSAKFVNCAEREERILEYRRRYESGEPIFPGENRGEESTALFGENLPSGP